MTFFIGYKLDAAINHTICEWINAANLSEAQAIAQARAGENGEVMEIFEKN